MVMNTACVSCIIVNWNHGHYLKRCLEALLAQEYCSFDLTLVDNGSVDGSLDWVSQNYPQVQIIALGKNCGFSRAFNQAVDQTTGRFVFSINPDVFLLPGFFPPLVKAIEQDEEVGMVAPKLLQARAPEILDSTGLFIDRRRRPYDRGQGEVDCKKYDDQVEIFGACGAAALYRRTMLQDVALRVALKDEYFDEDFFAYYEDVDLAWRAQHRGWRCVYAPFARALHVRGSGDRLRHRATGTGRGPALAWRNRYLMIIKNDSLKYFLLDLPLILMAEIPWLAYAALKQPWALQGILELVRSAPSAFYKRRLLREQRRVQQQHLRRWFAGPSRRQDG